MLVTIFDSGAASAARALTQISWLHCLDVKDKQTSEKQNKKSAHRSLTIWNYVSFCIYTQNA